MSEYWQFLLHKTCNVRITQHWGAFSATVVVVERSNKYYMLWVSVCSLSYPACNAHAPYCLLWPVLLYSIFPHYLINGTIFEETLMNIKCVFWFSLQLLSETFLILRRTERDMIKMYIAVHVKYRLLLSDFNKTFIFSTEFKKKYGKTKLHKYPSSGSRVFPCGRTDRQRDGHDETDSRFSQFRRRA